MSDIASLSSGTTFACTFMLPAESTPAAERELRALTEHRAAASGAPWISFYEPDEVLDMARTSRFRAIEHVPAASWDDAWFRSRADHLHPSAGEEAFVAYN